MPKIHNYKIGNCGLAKLCAECIFLTWEILWDYAGRPQEDVMLNSKPDLGQYFDSAFEIYLAPLPLIYYI